MLSANQISFKYPKAKENVIEGFSLELRPGEFLALTGKSGRGKTTLARLLSGYDKPNAGAITVDGSPIQSFKGFCPVQLIFQHPEKAINPRWPMRKVLLENGMVYNEITESLGIEAGWLNRFPNELSGGELQRFCVARALTAKTRYLIADEMTTMLDAITQAQIWQTVQNWAKKNNAGVLVVSHDAALLSRLCCREIALI
jgi:peptide/nickel transport system ATP-binding protein